MRVVTLACRDERTSPVPALEGVTHVPDLCADPSVIDPHVAGADRLVLVVHPEDVTLATLQRHVRAAGIDPMTVQYVPAESIAQDATRMPVILAGVMARAAALADGEPEHVRPVFGGTRSRREFLTMPRPHYEPVPHIDESICVSGNGCASCVAVCPRNAYARSGPRVLFDKYACVSCGRCITECPTGAITEPTTNAQALRAQIQAMVEAAETPIGVAFVCRRRRRFVVDSGWYELEVPCAGMVPATWPLATLLLGAGSAAIVPCTGVGCHLGQDSRVDGAVAGAQVVLTSAGIDRERVTDGPGRILEPIAPVGDLDDPFGTHGPAEVALAVRDAVPSNGPVVAHGPAMPLGVVTIDPDTCTVCVTCTEVCPTGALASETSDGHVAVSFDASTCTGCGQCVPACPERARGAIHVDRRLDTAALSAGRRTLVHSATPLCESCGRPIASAAMLDRIGSLLGAEHAGTLSYLARRCLDCRGTG